MRLLHTSDWHLGRTLYGRKRYDEFEQFFTWLANVIEQERVDVLVAAGDIFDSPAPPNRAQEIYYRFLCRAASLCRHVVITAGNHDSPSFLTAPRVLLRNLNIHTAGAAVSDPRDAVLVLDGADGKPGMIVCAVPYLRERDVRESSAGETAEDRERKMTEGIRNHYAAVTAAAEAERERRGCSVPIVVTGHLFTAGGHCDDGDAVRELYVGSLCRVPASVFPASADYAALGHLHSPQRVDGAVTRRFSGSPLAMGFGDAGKRKAVIIADFAEGAPPSVRELPVPVFQELAALRGDWETIAAGLTDLAAAGSRAWLEITYDGQEIIGDLRERLENLIAGTHLEILQVKNTRVYNNILGQMQSEETLASLDEYTVFTRCLDANRVSEDERPELIRCYREIVQCFHDADGRAE